MKQLSSSDIEYANRFLHHLTRILAVDYPKGWAAVPSHMDGSDIIHPNHRPQFSWAKLCIGIIHADELYPSARFVPSLEILENFSWDGSQLLHLLILGFGILKGLAAWSAEMMYFISLRFMTKIL